MSTKITLEHGNRILESIQDLEKYFKDGVKPSEERRIGIEFEALGVLRDSLKAIRYTDHILPIFTHLIRSHGYGPICEEGRLIGLEKEGRLVALEPGGQLELSGSPLKTLLECRNEHEAFLQEVSGHPLAKGVGFLGAGLHPVSPSYAIETVPKPRYGIMAPYLSKKGSRALDMMKRTATIQVNLDYTSIQDLLRKVRLCFRLTPVYQAMFANSPIGLGRPNGYQTERAAIWQDTDPDRCGLVPSLMGQGVTLRDYLDYVLDIPIILLEEEGRLLPVPPIPFRRFLEEGLGGRRPTLSDFVLHLSLVFRKSGSRRSSKCGGPIAFQRPWCSLPRPCSWGFFTMSRPPKRPRGCWTVFLGRRSFRSTEPSPGLGLMAGSRKRTYQSSPRRLSMHPKEGLKGEGTAKRSF